MQLSSSFYGAEVLLKVARFIGSIRLVRKRPPNEPILRAVEQLDADWEVIESQKMMISRLAIENSQKLTEIEHLEDQLKWLHDVMGAANIKLSDYDYLRKPKGKTPAQRVRDLRSRRKLT